MTLSNTIKQKLDAIYTSINDSIPTKITDLEDDSDFIKSTDISNSPQNNNNNPISADAVHDALSNKVDKVVGKGLSTNDYTTADKNIVDGISLTYATKQELSQAQIDPSSVDLTGYAKTVDLIDYVGVNDEIDAGLIIDYTEHGNIGSSERNSQQEINFLIDTAIGDQAITITTMGGNNNYAQRYKFQQGSTDIGTINIPKDFLIESVTLNTCNTANSPQQGYAVGDKYFDFAINTQDNKGTTHIYVNVKDIITDGTITKNKLSSVLQNSLDAVDTNLGVLNTDTTSLKNSLIIFDNKLRAFNGSSALVSNDLSTLSNDLTTFMSNLTQLGTDLSNTDASLDKLLSTLEIFADALTGFDGNLNEFKTKLQQDGISAQDISNLSNEIELLFGIMAPLQSQINDTQDDIGDLQDDVDTVQESMYGTDKDPSNVSSSSLVGVVNSTTNHLYGGNNGTGTIANPASGTMMSDQKIIEKEMFAGTNGTGTISQPANGTVVKRIKTVEDDIDNCETAIDTAQTLIGTVNVNTDGDLQTQIRGVKTSLEGLRDANIFFSVTPYTNTFSAPSKQIKYVFGKGDTVYIQVIGAVKEDDGTTSYVLDLSQADTQIQVTTPTGIITNLSNYNSFAENKIHEFSYTFTDRGVYTFEVQGKVLQINVNNNYSLLETITSNGLTIDIFENGEYVYVAFYGRASLSNANQNIKLGQITNSAYRPPILTPPNSIQSNHRYVYGEIQHEYQGIWAGISSSGDIYLINKTNKTEFGVWGSIMYPLSSKMPY